MSSALVPAHEPPYYAVVFTSRRTEGDNGYGETAARLGRLAAGQPGFLGHESVRDADGRGITVAYFTDEEAIAGWRADERHAAARAYGREHWYEEYVLHVARVERAYSFTRPGENTADSVDTTGPS
ncbi:antibiotic biosynthesis monooxygenase family protein [Streptomyces sp. SP18CS02]|uniref:antibiotic biosynthesis monooxygenase family protein n=1 Tax=Streptomyces sp. SP18CS02 TaxID=3002531 RepID=UPI002E7732F0|nr:antibiotic biosynthesis monooxygenase [Streptomyces sp. SP18CS02]MEE1756606.1 antibiotic biosynthesis monooxygenase [Streptomyces sp. SP18CS02]